jgi:hypothetical protein
MSNSALRKIAAMPATFEDTAGPGMLRKIAYGVCAKISFLGLLASPVLLLWAALANLDPRTEADGIRLCIACLTFPALSLAGLLVKKRPWLGALGLAILVWACVLSPSAGMLTDAQQQAYEAVKAGDAEGLRQLLEAGVDPDLQGEDRFPLLSAAVSSNNPDVIKVLIDAGADVNVRKGQHVTPLLLAVYVPRCRAALPLARAGARFEDRFFDNAEFADPPTYRGKNVVEIYYGRKREFAKTWAQDEACWLQFEAVMKQKKEAAASFRCDTPWAVAHRKLYQVFGSVTPC